MGYRLAVFCGQKRGWRWSKPSGESEKPYYHEDYESAQRAVMDRGIMSLDGPVRIIEMCERDDREPIAVCSGLPMSPHE